MKKLLSIALLASLGFSAGLTVIPYGSYISYSHSTKNYGSLAGIYASSYNFPLKSEVDGQFLNLEYKKGTPNYNQKDLTFIESYYFNGNYKIRAGVHNIFITQANNPNHYQKVLFGGVLYYKYLKYNTGVDYYYSFYKNLDVQQISPKIGFNFGNYYAPNGAFYAEVKLNYINIFDKSLTKTNLNKNYLNTDLKLVNKKGFLTTTLQASLGTNMYKVGNNGFTVYNLGEKYENSFGIDFSYKIDKNGSVEVGYTNSKFKENNKNAYSNTYTASFALKF